MSIEIDPLNFDLLLLPNEDTRGMRPVKVQDIFEGGGGKNFHSDGLFSVETFGKQGEERRMRLYAYIKLNTKILHPLLYICICDLKGLYGDIMAGKSYAVFNEEIQDFEKTNSMDGGTGYEFFCKYLPKLKFEQRPSTRRAAYIELVEKYRKTPYVENLAVIPAGLRDYMVDENGKPSEDEVNTLYRRMLAAASNIENTNPDINPEYIDAFRFKMQLTFVEIYDYFIGLTEGKNKLTQGKWAARKMTDSTRNVITSYNQTARIASDATLVDVNETVVGLYQFMRAVAPLMVNRVRSIMSEIFPGPNVPALMVNKKTLKQEPVLVPTQLYDDWMTYEGIEGILAKYGEEDLRHEQLDVDTHWFALIYKGPDGTFRLVHDIDDIPEGRSKDHVTPVTLTELLYIAIYSDARKIPNLVTRYPVSGFGGIYPSFTYLKSTTKSEVRYELDETWNLLPTPAPEFPVFGAPFYNSLSPSPAHNARLVADYDGDMCSFTCLLMPEAILEIENLLKSRDFYVGLDGKMFFSVENDVNNLVFKYITG